MTLTQAGADLRLQLRVRDMQLAISRSCRSRGAGTVLGSGFAETASDIANPFFRLWWTSTAEIESEGPSPRHRGQVRLVHRQSSVAP